MCTKIMMKTRADQSVQWRTFKFYLLPVYQPAVKFWLAFLLVYSMIT